MWPFNNKSKTIEVRNTELIALDKKITGILKNTIIVLSSLLAISNAALMYLKSGNERELSGIKNRAAIVRTLDKKELEEKELKKVWVNLEVVREQLNSAKREIKKGNKKTARNLIINAKGFIEEVEKKSPAFTKLFEREIAATKTQIMIMRKELVD